MIISRTPFRISFFGGGTDFPEWYNENGGCVISTSINKYCYITIRNLPPFFKYKFKIRYYKSEEVNSISKIKHPVVRAVLEKYDMNGGLEINHNADLPAMSGLGSSSAFTVGLTNGINAIKNIYISKSDLAKEAIHIEQNILKENVGSQDQVATSFGGLNKISFQKNSLRVNPVIISKKKRELFQNNLLLFFTGYSRNSSDITKFHINAIRQRSKELNYMKEICEDALTYLQSQSNDNTLGKLLNEQWNIKKSLTKKVSNNKIDQMYETALKNGALGGKILGAGGGGFMLLYAKKKYHKRIKNSLNNKLFVPFEFENTGSQIIYYQN